MTVVLAMVKMLGIVFGMLLVDYAGRRPLLVYGSLGMSISLAFLTVGASANSVVLILASIYAFMFSFSISWAGVFWVLMSEMFSMRIKSAAASAATAMLFLGGAVMDAVFLTIYASLGDASFLLYAFVSACGGMYVYAVLPETKQRALGEIQKAFELHNETMRYGCPTTLDFFRVGRRRRRRTQETDEKTSLRTRTSPALAGEAPRTVLVENDDDDDDVVTALLPTS